MTINDGLEQFLQMMFYERNISNNSLDAYKEDLKSFFKYIGKDNCEELNIEDLEILECEIADCEQRAEQSVDPFNANNPRKDNE